MRVRSDDHSHYEWTPYHGATSCSLSVRVLYAADIICKNAELNKYKNIMSVFDYFIASKVLLAFKYGLYKKKKLSEIKGEKNMD